MPQQFSNEIRYARLEDGEVRYATETDRQQEYGRQKARMLRDIAREPTMIEADEVGLLPEILGGRAARPTKPIVLFLGNGKKVTVYPNGRTEAAAIQETLMRKMEEPGAAPRTDVGPKKHLVIAREVMKYTR